MLLHKWLDKWAKFSYLHVSSSTSWQAVNTQNAHAELSRWLDVAPMGDPGSSGAGIK